MRSFIISAVCISAFLITGADQVFSQDSWNMEYLGGLAGHDAHRLGRAHLSAAAHEGEERGLEQEGQHEDAGEDEQPQQGEAAGPTGGGTLTRDAQPGEVGPRPRLLGARRLRRRLLHRPDPRQDPLSRP